MTTAIATPSKERALGALNQVPPFSATLNRLLALLARESVFLFEIAAVIEKDTVLAGQILKLVNSALYARSGTINSVGHAVAILGLNKLRNMALSLSVTRMWKQLKTPSMWSQANFNLHSVATAILADTLAQKLPVHYAEGAFTAGLLHAMGKMLIAFGAPVEYEVIVAAAADGRPVEDIERKFLGCCHSELAGLVLAHWKLPPELQHAVEHQHEELPLRDGKRELASLLHVTHDIVHELHIDFEGCVPRPGPGLDALFTQLGLGAHQERILEDFRKEFDTLRTFF